MEPVARYDAIVIGGGIAGFSAAYELAGTHSVLLLERETFPGYHATGRSAALFSEIYGCAEIRALSRASRPFFTAPPPGFAAEPLLSQRGAMWIAGETHRVDLDKIARDADVAAATTWISSDEAVEKVPILREEWCDIALYEPGAYDIDVHSLLHGYLRGFVARGGAIRFDAEVGALERGAEWTVRVRSDTFRAPVVVNASGAWAGELARLADLPTRGLLPKRRTAILIEPPEVNGFESWPLVIAANESFYFKPDAGRLLVSPADEEPCSACDVQPDELGVAMAAHRFEEATGQVVRRIHSRWAGLRTFTPDRRPVIGFDPEAEGFFWLAGQGGYGVQTAPAAGRLAAAIVRGDGMEDELMAVAPALAPSNLRAGSSDSRA